MTLTDTLEQVRLTCRMRRLSRHTESCYSGWIARFARHVASHPNTSREERVRSYLETLAPRTSDSAECENDQDQETDGARDENQPKKSK